MILLLLCFRLILGFGVSCIDLCRRTAESRAKIWPVRLIHPPPPVASTAVHSKAVFSLLLSDCLSLFVEALCLVFVL